MVEPPTPSVQSWLGGYIQRVGDTVTRWHHPMSSSSQQPPLHLPVIRHKKSGLLWIAPPLPPAGFVTHDTRPTFPPQSTPKMLEEPWTILDMWAAFSFAPFSFPFPYFPINCCGYKVKSKDAKRHKSGAAGRGIPAAGSRAPIFIMDLAAHLHTVQHTTHHYSIEKDYGSFYWISWMVLTHTCTTLISSLPDDEWPCWRWLKIITCCRRPRCGVGPLWPYQCMKVISHLHNDLYISAMRILFVFQTIHSPAAQLSRCKSVLDYFVFVLAQKFYHCLLLTIAINIAVEKTFTMQHLFKV